MLNLARLDGAKDYSIYWIDDQYPLGGENPLDKNNYRFYEWSSIFEKVWGDETRIGIDQRYSTPTWLADYKPYFTKFHNLSGFDPAGCQATLTIRQGNSDYSAITLVKRYFYFKFLVPKRMSDFLANVTQIQVQPLSSPLAVNCNRQ